MPRVRMLKPEHRSHRKVGPLSDFVYRLWVSMICEADDYGRFVCDAQELRVLTWGYHPKIKAGAVEDGITLLNALGLIRTYEIDFIRYAFFPSWGDHQKPKYPTKPKLPAPPSHVPGEASPKTGEASPESLHGLNRVGLGRDELNRTELDREGRGDGEGNRHPSATASASLGPVEGPSRRAGNGLSNAGHEAIVQATMTRESMTYEQAERFLAVQRGER